MPVTALSDNKQSVKVLLMSGIQHAFLIPEYQRPYAWTFDQVDTLFSDIWDFTESTGGPEREATYFLGSIVKGRAGNYRWTTADYILVLTPSCDL